MDMIKTWVWTPALLVALAAGSYALFRYLSPEPPPGLIYGDGHIDGTEIRVASEVAGRVVESRLVEGRATVTFDFAYRH
jgi:HlyD family secretion protein